MECNPFKSSLLIMNLVKSCLRVHLSQVLFCHQMIQIIHFGLECVSICSVSRIVLYALGAGPKVWFLELQELVKYKFLDFNQIYWQKLPRWVIRWSWCMIFENHCSRGHTNEVKWNSVILTSLHKNFLVSRNLSIVKKN